MKRLTHLPQVGLGAAFAWGIPMAFAAENNHVPLSAWFLFITGMVWPILYDTMYALVDREDDVKIGVKSTAILFQGKERRLISLLQVLFVTMLIIIGFIFHLSLIYDSGLIVVIALFIYQHVLIKDLAPEKCFQAFLNNQWVGFIIFISICLSNLK